MAVFESSPAPRPLMAGTRCGYCDRFTAVPEGGQIFLCHKSPWHRGTPLRLEHHTRDCIEMCGPACDCPCHEYRPRDETK